MSITINSTLAEITAAYNAIADKPVKKFASKSIALARYEAAVAAQPAVEVPSVQHDQPTDDTLPAVAYYNMPTFGEPNTRITLETLDGKSVTSRRKVHKSVAGNFVMYTATWFPGQRLSLSDLELDSKPELTAQIVRRVRSWFGKGAVSVTSEGIQINLRLPQ